MNFLKSKTMMFSLLLAALGAVQASWGIVDDYLSPRASGVAAMAIAVLVALLRGVTTKPLDEK